VALDKHATVVALPNRQGREPIVVRRAARRPARTVLADILESFEKPRSRATATRLAASGEAILGHVGPVRPAL
jgi:hypothetical protein